MAQSTDGRIWRLHWETGSLFLEVVDAMVSVWGGIGVGVRLAPVEPGVHIDSNPVALLTMPSKSSIASAWLTSISSNPAFSAATGTKRLSRNPCSKRLRKISKGDDYRGGRLRSHGAEAILQKGAPTWSPSDVFCRQSDLPCDSGKGFIKSLCPATFYGGDDVDTRIILR